MKLKYYLRGLAVGVILTTIILTVANRDNGSMTDAQIRQRALELGMIESDSLKLSDLEQGTQELTGSEESCNPSISMSESAVESITSDSQESETESEAQDTDQTTDETVPPTPVDGASDASVPPSSESTESVTPVTIIIKSGDSSYTVSKALAAAGLVEDAVEYDNYLCNNGYSRTIRTGTYEIVPGMTYEEIAKIIAR